MHSAIHTVRIYTNIRYQLKLIQQIDTIKLDELISFFVVEEILGENTQSDQNVAHMNKKVKAHNLIYN